MAQRKWSTSVRFRVMFRGWHGWLHGALMLAMVVIPMVGVLTTRDALANPLPWVIAYVVVVVVELAHIISHFILDQSRLSPQEPPELPGA